MEEKKEFFSPRVEIIKFEHGDIITTSGNGRTEDPDDGGIELPDDVWG